MNTLSEKSKFSESFPVFTATAGSGSDSGSTLFLPFLTALLGFERGLINELLSGKNITMTSAEANEVFGEDVNLPETFNLAILLDKLNVA